MSAKWRRFCLGLNVLLNVLKKEQCSQCAIQIMIATPQRGMSMYFQVKHQYMIWNQLEYYSHVTWAFRCLISPDTQLFDKRVNQTKKDTNAEH